MATLSQDGFPDAPTGRSVGPPGYSGCWTEVALVRRRFRVPSPRLLKGLPPQPATPIRDDRDWRGAALIERDVHKKPLAIRGYGVRNSEVREQRVGRLLK